MRGFLLCVNGRYHAHTFSHRLFPCAFLLVTLDVLVHCLWVLSSFVQNREVHVVIGVWRSLGTYPRNAKLCGSTAKITAVNEGRTLLPFVNFHRYAPNKNGAVPPWVLRAHSKWPAKRSIPFLVMHPSNILNQPFTNALLIPFLFRIVLHTVLNIFPTKSNSVRGSKTNFWLTVNFDLVNLI